MTDNEIIKALEICASGTCEGCNTHHGYDCVPVDMGTILSLINRQKAEIYELQHINSDLEIALKAMRASANTYKAELLSSQAYIRVDAIKEFADMLKDQFDRYGVDYTAYAIVDDVAKEMGIDSNE